MEECIDGLTHFFKIETEKVVLNGTQSVKIGVPQGSSPSHVYQ